MKIVSIGDIHGRNTWETAPDADLYVFVGDYVDSFTETDKEITDNLLKIIEFKKESPDKVILLWGNHDVQYALQPPGSDNGKYYCSGYRSVQHWDLYPIFRDNFDLFQFAYEYDKYLFTHAGVHTGWYMNRFQLETEHDPNLCSLSEKLNLSFLVKMDCLFDVGHIRGGYRPVGGPLWLHKHPARKYLEGYHHIVGHTETKKIHTETAKNVSVTFIDAPKEKKQFYIINI